MYDQNRTTGGLSSKEQLAEASSARSESRSESRSKPRGNHVPIPMAGNNKLAQLMKIIKKMQAKKEESGKKVELLLVTF